MIAAVIPAWPMLFAYGTLMEPRLLAGVLGRPLAGISLLPAKAPGFRAVVYPGRTYPALVEAAGAMADGLAIAGLSAADRAILDLFEGDEYVRDVLTITVSGRRMSADYYRPCAAIGGEAPPWHFAEWRRLHGEAMIAAESETAAALRRLAKG